MINNWEKHRRTYDEKEISKSNIYNIAIFYVLLVVISFGYDLFNETEISSGKISLFFVVLVIAIVANVLSHYSRKIERRQNDLSIKILESECAVTQARYDMV